MENKTTKDQQPIWTLIDTVQKAIWAYDRSDDHLSHGNGADCIRCRLQAAFSGNDVKEFQRS